ncbi:acetyl-CoA carboxylase biotin carboxyl carrier protein [Carnobacteriaceae bacterium zg-ZUI240]|nr:acetyl-CoA carboxylase biotin carboxyl carrier protein [Carnobacteriaceae bacterium zg-ZUI240]
MKFEEIKTLIETLNASDLMYLDIQQNDFSLTLSKRDQADVVRQVPVAESVKTEETPMKFVETSKETSDVSPIETGQTVNSPLVGVAYLAPSPDAPTFKKVGDVVAVGDVLCIVEAMKIMNEIKSDVAGTISAVLVENQEIVEFGQPLFRIS